MIFEIQAIHCECSFIEKVVCRVLSTVVLIERLSEGRNGVQSDRQTETAQQYEVSTEAPREGWRLE